jgi:hypothetical protein
VGGKVARIAQFGAALVAAGGITVAAVAWAPLAVAGSDSWTSLFAGTPFDGAGWASCPDPITVTVDTRALEPAQRDKARAAMTAAIMMWNRAKVTTFEYGGELPMQFDVTTGMATPADGQARSRHIYFTLVKASASQVETGIVGLATPLRVEPSTKAIIEGSAAFQAQYVNRQSRAKLRELFAHEIGHVLGLGHSTSKKDIMYAVLQGNTDLGAGDRAGGWALLKPCPAA